LAALFLSPVLLSIEKPWLCGEKGGRLSWERKVAISGTLSPQRSHRFLEVLILYTPACCQP
jgi:hypothetical protein